MSLGSGKGSPYKTLLKCEQCGARLTSQTNLEHHKNTAHARVGKRFKCKSCNFVTNYLTDFKRHLKRSHKKQTVSNPESTNCNPFKCVACNLTFETRTSLIDHAEEWHSNSVKIEVDNNKYKCLECKRLYASWLLFYKHSHKVHGGVYICGVCHARCKNFGVFQNHQYAHDDNNNMPRMVMVKPKFEKVNGDIKFKPKTQSGEIVGYKCPHCSVISSNITLFLSHEERKHTFRCLQCPKIFRSKSKLEIHDLKAHHREIKIIIPKLE